MTLVVSDSRVSFFSQSSGSSSAGRCYNLEMSLFHRILISLIAIAMPLFFINCSSGGGSDASSPTTSTGDIANDSGTFAQKGNRTLGIDIVDETTASTFMQNVSYAKAVGAEYFILDLLWNQIETAGSSTTCTLGTYVDAGSRFATLNSTLPSLDIKVTINFNLSTTNIWGLPSVFAGNDFIADPTLQATKDKMDNIACRYYNALNYALSQMPNVKVISLQIGNEIDYLSQATNPNFWANYWRFYAAAYTYAKTIRTTSIVNPLDIGVTASLSGLTGGKGEVIRQGLAALNQVSDFVSANYYPFEAGGSTEKISQINSKFSSLITAAGTKNIHIQEYGCQSGTISRSSTDLQTQCYSELLKIWDSNATKITHINLLRMNDLSYANAYASASSYSTPSAPDATFVDYIQSLGLRTNDGQDKPAYSYIKTQLKKRGW